MKQENFTRYIFPAIFKISFMQYLKDHTSNIFLFPVFSQIASYKLKYDIETHPDRTNNFIYSVKNNFENKSYVIL